MNKCTQCLYSSAEVKSYYWNNARNLECFSPKKVVDRFYTVDLYCMQRMGKTSVNIFCSKLLFLKKIGYFFYFVW